MGHATTSSLFIFFASAQRIFALPFTSASVPWCMHLSSVRVERSLTVRSMSTPGSDECGVGLKDIAATSRGIEEITHEECGAQPRTPWRAAIALSIAKSRSIRGGNYVQLSTVDSVTHEPRCRTVVFRGFQKMGEDDSMDTSCVMKMITDTRSNKVKELTTSASSIAEMVWWFSKSSEQYRIRGRIQFIGEPCERAASEELNFLYRARKEQWGNLSDAAREQFYWKDPGIPYSVQNKVPKGGRDADGKVLPPPKEFLLMLLHPFWVDYLCLTDNYRQVDELDVDCNSWRAVRVNP